MSEGFWIVFWGVVATLLGVAVAALLQGTLWVGAVIGLVVYLILLALLYSGGNGPTFFFLDID